ncbi:hypothetical protein V6N12_056080 [Hibiscus sabdariffa]|uniref:B3 domain-containing protein n=1 Tax=Hibiscus sabdariffa TaxID=183260 RepID=A0ABR2CRH7_9ROSI
MAELSRADFKYVDPNWSRFECLVQIAAKFDEERSQINHDHDQSLCKKENTGLKQRFTFNNNAGKKTKREFKGEDDDGEWEGGLKPELKRSKKQRFTFNTNAGKKMKREFKEEDGDEEWESGLKPKLKRSKKQKPPCPIPTPDLPDRFKRHISENMGGSGPVLVIQKALFFSDVNPTASRLSVPFSQVKTHDFLKSTEADALANQSPMEVCLLGPSMEKTTMTLNRWEMGKTSLYVMTESWNSVVKSNKLKKGDVVQLWSFRNTRETAFAIRKLPLVKAKRYLEDVMAHNQAIPFRRFCSGVGRTAQAKNRHSNGQGRWPVKSAEFILDLLKNAEACLQFLIFHKSEDDDGQGCEEEKEKEGQDDSGSEDSEDFEVERLLNICFGDPNKMRKRGLYFKDSINPSLAITNHDAEEATVLAAKEDVNHMDGDGFNGANGELADAGSRWDGDGFNGDDDGLMDAGSRWDGDGFNEADGELVDAGSKWDGDGFNEADGELMDDDIK